MAPGTEVRKDQLPDLFDFERYHLNIHTSLHEPKMVRYLDNILSLRSERLRRSSLRRKALTFRADFQLRNVC